MRPKRVFHLLGSDKGTESLKTAKRHLSSETPELIRQRGAARASSNYQLTSKLAKLCKAVKRRILKREERRCWLKQQGRVEHPQCPPELRQLQDQDDRSPTS
ncbi:unnamed protein product [Heligmosomoides polygyrus]|uniref:BZIP_Maf domain-containing protein n=1 Tax=Heligmosomoides polygyrus TaxID=6339 RepID=A0A183G2P9_HELPZ|nr:unnamed protein product [Heligmosomoides polygyrus]